MSVSPSGARIAMEYRGEIRHRAGREGRSAQHHRDDGRCTSARREWSPDGRSLAYFSDAGGEYALHIRAQDGKGEAKVVQLAGSGFYDAPVWSPDSRRIAFRDNGRTLYVLDGRDRRDQQGRHRADLSARCVLGHDLQLVARQQVAGLHDHELARRSSRHCVWSVDKQASFPITDGLSDVSEPVFDRNGKYLYLLGSTDAGPVRDWFSQANADMRSTSAIYLVVLKKGEVSPLAKESDEEKARSGRQGRDGRKGARPTTGPESEDRPVTRRRPPGRDRHRHRRARRHGSSRCRCRLATIRPCRPAKPASCSSCGRPTASRRCSSSTSRPARPRRGCRRPMRSSSPPTPRSCCIATARPSTWWSRRRRPMAPRARSTSRPCRCASIRRPSGRRSSTRPGASTATTSTRPTTTAATGRR